MNIIVLSRDSKLYSTKRLVEACEPVDTRPGWSTT